MKRPFLTALVASLVAASAFGSTVSVSLDPSSGTVSGAPGTVVGWGYDVTNSDPSNWVVLNDSFVTGSLSSGTDGHYVDYIASSFIVISPSSSTGTVAFIKGTAGTGQFEILPVVPPLTVTGGINIDYSVFSQDPNSPLFNPGSFVTSGTVSANAQVDVVSAVPEPSSVALIGLALLPIAVAGWRRSKLSDRHSHR